MKATYVSVWDGGVTIRSKCEYDPETNEVSDIESKDVDGLEICEDEYIELDNGVEVRDFILDMGNEPESLTDVEIAILREIVKK